jgi:hypothetical protein
MLRIIKLLSKALERKSQVLYESEKIILQAANEHQKVCVLRLGGIYGSGRKLVNMFGGLAGMTMPGKGDRKSRNASFRALIKKHRAFCSKH